jgi:hypothetical protein
VHITTLSIDARRIRTSISVTRRCNRRPLTAPPPSSPLLASFKSSPAQKPTASIGQLDNADTVVGGEFAEVVLQLEQHRPVQRVSASPAG